MGKKMISLLLSISFCVIVTTSSAHENVSKVVAQHGISWIVQTSGSNADLRGVSAVDANICWASGSKGTVLRTIDGGKTWKLIKLGISGSEKMDFRDIEAFSKDAAIVMSITEPAKLFKTTDGGTTWVEIYSNNVNGMFFDALAFSDQNTGFAIGDPVVDDVFYIIHTSDGGKTWERISKEALPKIVQGESAFAASGTCITMLGQNDIWFCTGGPAARVFHSADQGKTWEVTNSSLSAGSASAGGFSIVFVDEKNGIIVGGDYTNESGTKKNAAVSGDGGKTWELIETKKPTGFREGVCPVYGTDPLMVVAVGLNGSNYSLDKGKTWDPIPAAVSVSGFHSVHFAKNGSGWAVGRGGLIAKFDSPTEIAPPLPLHSPRERYRISVSQHAASGSITVSVQPSLSNERPDKETMILIKIFDAQGRLSHTQSGLSAGGNLTRRIVLKNEASQKGWPAGLYFICVAIGPQSLVKKVFFRGE